MEDTVETSLADRITVRDLLADGQKAPDVAALCGFSSQTHMIHRFRAVFGYTPNAIR
ncbi:AraC family transcriptional regulator [Rhodovulum sulfidophilum]|nr:AraC family transcriptional regulator [Rhodovulum sulfidophilum]